MRAAIITAPKTVQIQELPIPTPEEGQVRVRVQGCGVCASNLATWEGMPWTQYPTEPGGLGHEAWGVVDAVGKGVSGVRVGDRVTGLFYKSYGEYDLAREETVLKLPDALSGDFPGEALGCAMNIFRRSEIRAGQTVAIIGAGFLGLLLTQLASGVGARVVAISRRGFALKLAREMGAEETLEMSDFGKTIEAVKQLTAGKLCDRVVEAVGKQSALDLASELTAERGKLIIAGYHQDGPRQVNLWLWNWRGIDVINAHERDPKIYMEGIRAAVDAVISGRIDPWPLYTHRYPLEKLGEALNATLERPDGFLKALVVYG